MYEDIFTQIRNEAEKRNLKENTINAYCNSVDYCLRTVNKDVSALTTDDVDAFLTQKRLGGLAPRTYNHYHSSIRFFYKRILKINWDDEDIPRMKLDYSVPTVLSRDEMHVPPKGFVRIRHYGLLSSRNKKLKITLCRNLLGCQKYLSRLKDLDAPAIIRLL